MSHRSHSGSSSRTSRKNTLIWALLVTFCLPGTALADGKPEGKAKDRTINKSASKSAGKTESRALEAGKAQTQPSQSYFEDEFNARKRKYAKASSTVFVNVPQSFVWKVLVDFEHYPEIFKRIESCHVTKRDNGLLFAETYLKPQMFVNKLCQHTVSDISQGPNYLPWKMLDGNFKSVVGSWTLSTAKDKANQTVCQVKYTLEADPGPIIPPPMVSFILHTVQHEVVTSLKQSCEKSYSEQSDREANALKTGGRSSCSHLPPDCSSNQARQHQS